MRMLIVEDDAKLAAVLEQGLVEQGGSVDVARDGEKGLQLGLARDYDVVILDLTLPRRDGLEVLRQLRVKGNRVPILVLTARGSVEDRVRGLDLGADDYLAKPFDFRELLARLRALVRRPPVEPRSVLRVADLELDPGRREARRAGRRLDLTAREFALLEYMMRRQGLVLTRSMILGNVWNLDYEGGSNLVEVYINYLRRKVDQDGEPKLIHTVRGVGYVLREDAE